MDEQTFTCTDCQSTNKGDAEFCRACGANRVMDFKPQPANATDPSACPSCVRPVRASDRFCLNCGHGLKTNIVEEGMFCYRCSRQLPETARYCFGCGLGTAVASAAQPSSTPTIN